MGTLGAQTDKLRGLLPQGARERLYAWHPGRGRRWARHPGLERVADPRHAVLTFDDGPDEDATPAVLDALDEARASATFFVLGSQVHAHPALGAELVRRGHEIALHGYEHRRHDRIDAASSAEDIRRGIAAVEDVLNVRCELYRPPYGKMSDAAADACRELGLKTVYWSAWGLDWEEVGAPRIAEVALAQMTGGAIVLLHDTARFARRPTAVPTAEAVGLIVAGAGDRGLSIGSLREALGTAAHLRVS